MPTTQVDILITAPNGCYSALELLKLLDGQVGPGFKVSVLETSGDCNLGNFSPTNFQIEHVFFDTQEEAEMRRDAFIKSKADWIVVLEDHILISERFIYELERFINQEDAAEATTFYAINGTAGSFGSRALFSWVWGLAESRIYPEKPEPVCSAFAVKRFAVVNALSQLGKELEIGELETKIIPNLINSSESEFITFLEVSHFEYVGIRVGAKAIFSNSRIMGHLEISIRSWRDWSMHLLRRYSLRPRQIQKVAPKTWTEVACLYFLAMVGFTGFLIGGLFGIGKADQNLAAAHPKIIKG